jgi:hypothetical protein
MRAAGVLAAGLSVAVAQNCNGAAPPATIPVTYCVQQLNGTLIPWQFQKDPTTGYIYLPLAEQAPTSFADIWAVLEVINATGTPSYGSKVSNIATIVDSVQLGNAGGTVVTQFQMVHLWLSKQPPATPPGAVVSIDLFDFNFTTGNGNAIPLHAYDLAGTVSCAAYATADGCIGGYSNANACLDPYADNFPCAFANVDVNGLPFTIANDFGTVGAFPAGNIIVDPYLKTANVYGGGDCGSTGPYGVSSNRNLVVQKLNEKLLTCPSNTPTYTQTSTKTSTASQTATQTATPTRSNTATSSRSATSSQSHTRTGSSSQSSSSHPSPSDTSTATSSASSTRSATPSQSQTRTSTPTKSSDPSASATPSSDPSVSATPSSSGVSVASASPSPCACKKLTDALKCYGSASHDWLTPAGLPYACDTYTLTHSYPNEYGEIWHGCSLLVDEFTLEFDLEVDQVRRDRDDCDDSGIEIVFYDKLRLGAGPTPGLTASSAGVKGGNSIPNLVKSPRSLNGVSNPPNGKHGEWALRLYPTVDDVYMFPSFGLADPLSLSSAPLATAVPKFVSPFPPHPKKDYGKFHITLGFRRSDRLLHVEWTETDKDGHSCNKDSKWFSTDIIKSCGCGDDHGWKAKSAVNASAVDVMYPPKHDDCRDGCLAGFGMRGWTEQHGYQRHRVSDLKFREGCGADV